MPSTTPHGPPGAKAQPGGRIGGARADFVASLGRKVNDARDLLGVIEEDPSTKPAREELRRRLHALGAGARLLRFEAMTQSLQEALAVLDRGAQAGALREEDVGFVARVLDDLPTLAWGEVPREGPGGAAGEAAAAAGSTPIAVLMLGDEGLARALSEEGTGRRFEVERLGEADALLELARSYGPDVLLVDVDVPRAPEVVEALLDDPLTSPVPVVVVGTFRAPDELARFVALGAARTLPKPVADDIVRATCDEVAVTRDGPTARVTLGEPTLEQLADRLAQELKRALVDSVEPPARSHRVPLGEGSEVLGAFWGAIARIQEIVSQKTGGTVRFGGEAPEGAIALAPILHQDLPGADRVAGRGRGAAADVRLQGRRVVVADDDPGVTWFIADLLRTAGCEVFEALDGAAALSLAFRVQPELVVSDILMPGMDGFALCRSLRRDVALRDTPVILLSWKEDLLQRVRELGASAAAYLRKETGSRAILARVREVLRPRARIEARLRGEGEVRGRLDGLTPRVLLELVCLIRGDARLALRDATYLYEIEVRGGAPRRATRTASDGSYRSGERALASLLGVGAGRFAVTSSRDPLRGELSGTVAEQLARPIAAARAALAATTGARTMNVTRLVFDEESLDDYLRATPEPTRSLIRRLSQGMTPRRLLLGGEASPSLIEDVLADLAARGAVRGVEGEGGDDLLGPAIDEALATLSGAPSARKSLPPNARSSAAIPAARLASPPPPPPAPRAPAPHNPPGRASLPPFRPPEPSFLSLTVVSEPPPRASLDSDPAPSSLEDAVMRELSDRLAEPHAPAPPSEPPPIIKPSDLLVRRASDPDLGDERVLAALIDEPVLGSIPPDAVVPAGGAGEENPAAPAPPTSRAESPSDRGAAADRAGAATADTDGDADAEGAVDAGATPDAEGTPDTVAEEPADAEGTADTLAEEPADAERAAQVRADEATASAAAFAPPAVEPSASWRAPEAGVAAAHAAGGAPARRPPWGPLLVVGVLAAAIGAYCLLPAGEDEPSPPAAPSGAPDPTPAAPSASSETAAMASAAVRPGPPSAVAPSAASATEAPPPGVTIPRGMGWLEVRAPAGASVSVDGKHVGSGPLVNLPADPGYHEVHVRFGGRDTPQVIEVRQGKTTRVAIQPPP